jgi:hypothetical protein
MHIRNRHTQKTQPPHAAKKKRGREREHMIYIMYVNSNRTPQTINKEENLWGYRLGTVSGKTNCHWGFKPGSRVHQPHTYPNRFSYHKTSTNCLGEITPTHPSAQQCCMQKHTNI